MNPDHPILALSPLFFAVPIGIFAVIMSVRFCQRYLGVTRAGGYLLAIGTVIASIATGIYVEVQLDRTDKYLPRDEKMSRALIAGLFVLTTLPLAIKLYRSWIGGHVTVQEKTPGAVGVRAWLSPANLVLGLSVSICAAKGFDYPFLGVLSFVILALLAYPAFVTLSQPGPSPLPVERAENLTSEREKVLSLLEAGKITAEESAELLNALGSTLKTPERARVAFSPENRTMLIGAALVLIGFFLPWFTINPVKELENATRELQGQMNQFAQQMPGMPSQVPMPFSNGNGAFNIQTGSVNICGGDVQHGFGWIILLLSVGTAVLPMVAAHLDPQMRRTVSMLALGAGAILLVYLVTGNLRFLNVGIVLASAGYFAQGACLVKRGGVAQGVGSVLGEHA
jgi:hypothetical protein